MSKYIIEFSDKPSYQEDNIIFYPCKQIPWWSVSKSNIDKLTPLDKALEEAYQRGLNDAWEAARKIVCDEGIDMNTLCTIFRRGCSDSIIRDYSAAEAIAKLKDYEEKQKADDEIKVGDEVQNCHEPDVCFVVASIDTLNEEISGFDRNGHTYSCRPKDAWRKTGRHFDIDKILEEMRE